MPTVTALPGYAIWSGPNVAPVLGPTEVTSAVLEVVTGGTGIDVASAVLEVVTGPTETLELSAAVLEVVTAEDLATTHISSAVLEVVTGVYGAVEVYSAVLEVVTSSVPEPRDVEVSRYPDIETERFGEDLVLPGVDDDVTPTVSGDWPTISGRPNLHAAVRRRLITTSGQLLHRPDYGASAETYVGTLGTPHNRSRLAAGAKQNLLQDPRLGGVEVRVSAPEFGQTVIELNITPTGEVGTDTVSVVSES